MEEGGKTCYNIAMGLPTEEPPVVSGVCDKCDGIRWPVGQSPKFIHIEFKDLVKCPACPVNPPNAIFVLEQDAAVVCRWLLEDSNWSIAFHLPLATSEIFVTGRGAGAGWNFFLDFGGNCQEDFTNWLDACGGINGAINGTAHVTWS